MSDKAIFYTETVQMLQKQRRVRKFKPMLPINGAFLLYEDEKFLNFCSHDYLGLADHPDVKKNAIRYLLQHGITASSESQDLYLTCQKELEQKLSKLLHRPAGLFFPSRYEANVTILSTLGHPESTLFLDEACHPSLFQGAKQSQALVQRYPHGHLNRLEHLLETAQTPTKIIVSESVFSTTGTIAALPMLVELADHFNAILYVDDSHAFGVAGLDGMGLCTHLAEVDILTGSLSKACGAYGGYLVCSEMFKDYLTSLSPVHTTFLFPPPIIGAIEAALDIIPEMEGERKQLQQRSHWMRTQFKELGFSLSAGHTPLISLEFQTPEEVDDLRSFLKDEKILVGPTRSFEGEEQCSRLNIALNVCHMPDHLTRLLDSIKNWQKVSVVCRHSV